MKKIDDKWKIWIWKNVERGCRKDHIFKALHDRGFDYANIRDELDHEPTEPLGRIVAPIVKNPGTECTRIASTLEKREVAPYLWELRDALSSAECAALIEAARHRLERSTIVADDARQGAEGEAVSELRTSSAAHFAKDEQVAPDFDAVSSRLRRLIAELSQLPESHQEPFQILRYDVGGHFEAHHDAFTENSEYLSWEGHRGGQRLFSFMVYLNEPIEGGVTEYPELGVTVAPEMGKAVFWPNVNQDGARNANSMHASRPVLAGEKWVLVCWIREGVFGEPLAERFEHERKGFDRWLEPAPSLEPPEWIVKDTQAQQARIPYFGAGGPACRGVEIRRLDPEIHEEIRAVYESVRGELREEVGEAIGTYIGTVRPATPPTLYFEVPEFNALVLKLLQPLHEEWCRFPLEPSACYGFRVYLPGAYLHEHVDRPKTHVISSTLCIDREVYQPWLLHGDDIDGRPFALDVEPGELLLYESAKIAHGRPVPMNGRFHVGMFVHYRPAQDHDLWVASPEDWWRKHRP